jgi:energy-coupling factor transporter ATP-binding protein EcfA2
MLHSADGHRRGASAKAIRTRVQSLLDMMEIGQLGSRYSGQISGGQRQRVALARALATEPRLLLLDEPFGALDAKVRKSLRMWLRALHDRMGLTSIFVTHDQAEAMEMADRVAVLRAGRIEQADAPARLYTEPASAFVHEFMGESVPFTCIVANGRARLEALPGIELPTHCPPGPAVALIRPHEIGSARARARARREPSPCRTPASNAHHPGSSRSRCSDTGRRLDASCGADMQPRVIARPDLSIRSGCCQFRKAVRRVAAGRNPAEHERGVKCPRRGLVRPAWPAHVAPDKLSL